MHGGGRGPAGAEAPAARQAGGRAGRARGAAAQQLPVRRAAEPRHVRALAGVRARQPPLRPHPAGHGAPAPPPARSRAGPAHAAPAGAAACDGRASVSPSPRAGAHVDLLRGAQGERPAGGGRAGRHHRLPRAGALRPCHALPHARRQPLSAAPGGAPGAAARRPALLQRGRAKEPVRGGRTRRATSTRRRCCTTRATTPCRRGARGAPPVVLQVSCAVLQAFCAGRRRSAWRPSPGVLRLHAQLWAAGAGAPHRAPAVAARPEGYGARAAEPHQVPPPPRAGKIAGSCCAWWQQQPLRAAAAFGSEHLDSPPPPCSGAERLTARAGAQRGVCGGHPPRGHARQGPAAGPRDGRGGRCARAPAPARPAPPARGAWRAPWAPESGAAPPATRLPPRSPPGDALLPAHMRASGD